MKQEGPGTDLDSEDPVPLLLPDGSTVQVRGRLDRIDREMGGGETEFTLWDYKTGSTSRYKKKGFNQGRLIQHVLYIHMAEKRLMECFGPDAKVKRFGFFFPGASGEGKRIEFCPEDIRDDGLNIIQSLCVAIQQGAFIATDTAKDCEYCDFRSICRDFNTAAQRSSLKAENTANTELAPFRRLRAYE
jgi:ATP-dependent helicase/DNAse subunit B